MRVFMKNTEKKRFIRSNNFKVLIIFLLIVIACVCALIYNKNKKFGLSSEAINLEKELSAEETIRLYFYCINRGDALINNILDDDNLGNGGWSYSIGLFEDIYIVDIKELLTENSPNERDVYEIKYFQVKYNRNLFKASGTESENTIDFDFILVKQEKASPWKIISIGNG